MYIFIYLMNFGVISNLAAFYLKMLIAFFFVSSFLKNLFCLKASFNRQ